MIAILTFIVTAAMLLVNLYDLQRALGWSQRGQARSAQAAAHRPPDLRTAGSRQMANLSGARDDLLGLLGEVLKTRGPEQH